MTEAFKRVRNALSDAAHVRVNGVHYIVSIEPAALADTGANERDLFVPEASAESGLASLTRGPALSTRVVRTVGVRCERLDDWLERARVDRIDVIKIDVEGGETAVVSGARRGLERLPASRMCSFERCEGAAD